MLRMASGQSDEPWVSKDIPTPEAPTMKYRRVKEKGPAKMGSLRQRLLMRRIMRNGVSDADKEHGES